MLRYPVSITQDSNGQLLVTFPDVPEAATAGDDEEQALAMAIDALETAIEFYFEDRKAVPLPSKAKRGQPVVEIPATATAKVLLHNEMVSQGIKKAELARRLHMAAPNVERIFTVRHATKLDTLEEAFKAIGRRLEIQVA